MLGDINETKRKYEYILAYYLHGLILIQLWSRKVFPPKFKKSQFEMHRRYVLVLAKYSLLSSSTVQLSDVNDTFHRHSYIILFLLLEYFPEILWDYMLT